MLLRHVGPRAGVQTARVSIWDTAGQERFHALGPLYYRDADGALLVYDITDEQSFKRVQDWVKELRKMLGEDIQIAIAGNKADMEKSRNVNKDEALRYAASVGATHHLTSAKSGAGVAEAFSELMKSECRKCAGACTQHFAISNADRDRGAGPNATLRIVPSPVLFVSHMQHGPR
jgi:Ras-related protein Rab-21